MLYTYLASLGLSHGMHDPSSILLPSGMWDLTHHVLTHIPCIERQILNHWTASKSLALGSDSHQH